MAHAVRPDSFIEISNFYTLTVYEKGSEVVGMIHTLLGNAEGFREGLYLYFERHDGQAVTCDDFISALGDANKTDLSEFMLWYNQAGHARSRQGAHNLFAGSQVRPSQRSQSYPPVA